MRNSNNLPDVCDNPNEVWKQVTGSDCGNGKRTQDVSLLDAAGEELGTPGNPIFVSGEEAASDSAALTSVACAASDFEILPANPDRRGCIIFADTTTTTRIAFGATATSTSFTIKLTAGSTYFMQAPIFRGSLRGISDVATGSLRVTELT